ncbi:MAG TPA: hypothetical protein VN668_17105 [Stellaceae bacterium]|nr:hypothetical protein [Stellaceae bacterium]
MPSDIKLHPIRRRMPGIPGDIAALARRAKRAAKRGDSLAWRIYAEVAHRGWVIRPRRGGGENFSFLCEDIAQAHEISWLFRMRLNPIEVAAILEEDARTTASRAKKPRAPRAPAADAAQRPEQ